MKRHWHLIFPLVALVVCQNLFAAPDSPLERATTAADITSPANVTRLDFSVPESPAFQLLTVEKNQILRPSTTKELALSVSRFVSDQGSFALPKQFGVEFAPFMLARGTESTQIETARDRAFARFTESIRISAATATADSGGSPTLVSIGVRASLKDDQDLRRRRWNEIVRETNLIVPINVRDSMIAASERLDSIINSELGSEARIELAEQPNRDEINAALANGETVSDSIVSASRLSPEALSAIRRLQQSEAYREAVARVASSFTTWFQTAYASKAANQGWNDGIFDIAFAFLFSTPDSTGRKPVAEKVSVWGTYGMGAEDWGQLLLGLNLAWERDQVEDKRPLTLSLSSRGYIGRNNYKFFMEAQLSMIEEQRAKTYFNSGGELKLDNEVWIEFSAGIENDNGLKGQHLVTKFNVKSGLDGLFHVKQEHE